MRVYFRIANHYDFDDPEYSETNVEFSFSEYNKNDEGYMVNYSYEEFDFDEDIDMSVVEKIATTMVKEYNENSLSLIATYNREIANVDCNSDFASSSILGMIPLVESVILLAPIWKSSLKISKAFKTF